MKGLFVVPCFVLLAGCATAPKEKMSSSEAFTRRVEDTKVDPRLSRAQLGAPKAWAAQFRQDQECEYAARDLRQQHEDEVAWAYMKACVAKGSFRKLEAFVEHWDEHLKSKPEAPQMLAQIIAARGGHVRDDLKLLQQKRIPLFDLGSAVNQGETYQGRYVLFVAKIVDSKRKGARHEFTLAEQAMQSEMATVFSGPRYGSASSSSGGGSVQWKSSGVHGSGSASGSYSRSGSSTHGKVEDRVTDSFSDTGQEVLLTVAKDDPFLTPEKNMLFLVRFDGSVVGDSENLSEGEKPSRVAKATLVAYHDLYE